MTELERALVALGQELDFPPEPELWPAVRERIERRRFAFALRRRALALAVALLVVAFGIAMAVPQARSAILRFFHIGAVTVERVDTLPFAREGPLAAGLGPPRSRPEAERRGHLSIVLPSMKGSPPRRYYAQPGLIATVLYFRGKPVLLAELEGDQASISKKFVTSGTNLEIVRLGRFGLWLEGGKHVLTWQFGPDQFHQIETRLAGNVLVWLVGDRTFRLEGDLDKAQMLELARDITRSGENRAAASSE
jgi:hypothetical protein